MKLLKLFLVPLAAFVLIVVALAAFDRLNYSWAAWGMAPCNPHCFCEVIRTAGISEPLSSYSNLFYILAGLLILGTRELSTPGEAGNRMTRRRGYITGFGAAVIGIGFTSLFFHVSLTTLGWWLDYMGMYAFVGFALVYGLARFRRWSDTAFLGAYLPLVGALGALFFAQPGWHRPALAALILGVILVEAAGHWFRRPLRIRTRYFLAALACFFAAYAVNMADESGALCHPASLWQWHAVWHLLTAIAAGLVYLYYRSENEMSAV